MKWENRDVIANILILPLPCGAGSTVPFEGLNLSVIPI